MIPLAIPNLAGNELTYLQDCVQSTFVSSVGPYVDRLERDLAEATGAAHAVVTASGTSALHAALHVLGVERDHLVILPAWTFIASANAISLCGARPWLFDITPESWTLDPRQVAATLRREAVHEQGRLIRKACGRTVSAIMPVYSLGHPADMDAFRDIADSFGLKLVADAAAALGAVYKGRPLGAMGADLSCLSFNGNKTLTAGGGGAIIGNDAAVAKTAKHVTTTARLGPGYVHDRVGFNYRMTNVEAAIGCAQLEQLDDFVAKKRRIAARYGKELIGVVPGAASFPEAGWADGACWMSGLFLPGMDLDGGGVFDALNRAGVGTQPFWRPLNLQAPYRDCPCADLPTTEAVWPHVLTLPCSTNLSDQDQSAVVQVVRETVAGG